jgi:plasmid stabilization system protein ParE
MAFELVWSAEAENDFKKIILYLIENWSVQSSRKFIEKTFRKLNKLSAMPTVARATSQPSIYIYKLDRKNVVFFSIDDKYIVLLSIYPYKKDITKSKYY